MINNRPLAVAVFVLVFGSIVAVYILSILAQRHRAARVSSNTDTHRPAIPEKTPLYSERRTGDLVMLRSGGPVMTVSWVSVGFKQGARTQYPAVGADWFDSNGQLCHGEFADPELQAYISVTKQCPVGDNG